MAHLATVYVSQITLAMRLSLADRVNFCTNVGGMLINNVFVLLMWFMFFAGFRAVGGWQQQDMALLLGLIMVVVGVAGVAAGGYRDLAAIILRGDIDALLVQPQPVLPRLLGSESLVHSWGDLATGIAILCGFAALGFADSPRLLLVLSCGIAIFVSNAVAFACLAFWARGARSFARDLVDFVIMLSSYPGSIWNGPIKLLVYSLLPAGFIVLLPVKLLRAPSVDTLLILIAVTIAYVAIAILLFNFGLRRYQRGLSPA